jgi:hypothetical protein
MQLLASYSFLNLYLHAGASRAMEAQWNGTVGSAELRRATLECVKLAREHRVTGWIADDRRLGPVRPHDLAWIATYVLPLLIKWGVQRFARVEGDESPALAEVDQAQEKAAQQLHFELRSFTDLEQARAWACG